MVSDQRRRAVRAQRALAGGRWRLGTPNGCFERVVRARRRPCLKPNHQTPNHVPHISQPKTSTTNPRPRTPDPRLTAHRRCARPHRTNASSTRNLGYRPPLSRLNIESSLAPRRRAVACHAALRRRRALRRRQCAGRYVSHVEFALPTRGGGDGLGGGLGARKGWALNTRARWLLLGVGGGVDRGSMGGGGGGV